MKTGAWYVIGFVVAFVYFYVYAVNYIRGVRAEDIELDPVTNIEDFHQRIRRQVQRLQNQPPHHAPHRQMPLPVSQQKSLRRADTSKFDTRQLQHPIHPRYSAIKLGNTFLNNFEHCLDLKHCKFISHFYLFRLSFDYHNYTSMTTFLRHVSTIYSNLTALYSIGQSVQGRELWVMVVSSSPYEHMIGKPNVKYVANMHGNEAVGRELMLHLILHLVQNYNSDYYIRWLLDNTRIHIMPSMNPDGFEVAQEGTCQGGQGRWVEEKTWWKKFREINPFFADIMQEVSISTEIFPTTLNKTTKGPNQKQKQSKSGFPKFNLFYLVTSTVGHLYLPTLLTTLQIPSSVLFSRLQV